MYLLCPLKVMRIDEYPSEILRIKQYPQVKSRGRGVRPFKAFKCFTPGISDNRLSHPKLICNLEKRYSKIDQRLARHFVYYVECRSSPPPFLCSQLITPFMISTNQEKGLEC